jgi:hypothetical protein
MHRYRVTASAEGNQAHLDVDLQAGETRVATLELDPLISITGRVVEHPSGKPVVGLKMNAARVGGSSSFTNLADSRTGADGRFTITNAPRGTIEIWGFPDGASDYYNHLVVVRTLDGPGTVDVGTLKRVKRMWKSGDEVRGLGFELQPLPEDASAEQRALVVARIDPTGAAAKTDLRVGDVITAIDGLDVTGGNTAQGVGLLIGATGSTATLDLKRGISVEIQR